MPAYQAGKCPHSHSLDVTSTSAESMRGVDETNNPAVQSHGYIPVSDVVMVKATYEIGGGVSSPLESAKLLVT